MTAGRPFAVALFAPRDAERMLPTIASLRAAHPQAHIVLGTRNPGSQKLPLPADETVEIGSLADLVNTIWRTTGLHVLAVGDSVVVPPGFLDRALAAVDDDVRVATVSFLSNAADHLSFPIRNVPSLRGVDGADEATITRRLRSARPEQALAPVAIPGGAAVLISTDAMGAVGELVSFPSGAMQSSLEDFSLRGRRRGFLDLVDTGTYVTRPVDLRVSNPISSLVSVERQDLLRGNPYFGEFLSSELSSRTSPMALGLSAARAKVTGLRVVVEAGCLGPLEMGTQVQTLALIKALAARDDVAQVGVALATPAPRYAEEILRSAKVEPRVVPQDDFSLFGDVDIVHRSYQPDRQLDVAGWRRNAGRTVVTIQDLIAYHVGAYHATGGAWLAYRDSIQAAALDADGVVVVSEDTATQIARECIPVPAARLFAVPNGTDHLRGDEPVRLPGELVARGATDGEFMLILGADYAHKNRDLGVKAWEELRRRGWRHDLVLAGAQVSYGSSRLAEVQAGAHLPGVIVMADVPSEERNWLLRHASVLFYPTSAEGFGLVPYEAARFGTPTVAIHFGPLREVAPDTPVWSDGWNPISLADAAETFLRDPGVARDQVTATIAAGASYTWANTAARLVDAYRSLLAQPPRA